MNCSELCCNHINENEIVLLYADSEMIENFVEITQGESNYTLIIILKKNQKKPKIDKKFKNRIIFMSILSLFSIMDKVNKVFIDCHSLMSDGAALATAGAYNIAIVAR